MRYLSFLLTPLIIFTPLNAGAQEDQSEAPYLYYYSDDLNAFIIERADGTDTHILGDGLMTLPDDGDVRGFQIDGPGWSPSGEWLAWTATVSYRNNFTPGYKPYVVSADGSRRLTSLDHLHDAQLAWSPIGDILFVLGRYIEMSTNPAPGEPYAPGYVHEYIAFIDASEDRVIKAFDRSTFFEQLHPSQNRSSPQRILWTPDGQHVILALSKVVQVFTIEVMARPDIRIPVDYNLVLTSEPSDTRSFVSPTGLIAYQTDETLVVEDPITGESTAFGNRDPDEEPNLYWNNAGEYGLLFGEHLWLIAPETGEMTLIHEAEPGLPVYAYPIYRPHWSPDGSHALFAADEQLYHLEIATTSLTELAQTKDIDLGWQWLAGGRVFIFERDNWQTERASPYIYDFDTATYTTIEIQSKFPYPLPNPAFYALSSDDQTVAFVNEGPVVYDIETDTCRSMPPDPGSMPSFYGGEVFWHEDGAWFIVYEDALWAGGGYLRHLGVANAAGTMKRDLSYSPGPTANTINWLPPRVDLDNLGLPIPEDALPQPEQVIHGSGWSGYLSWSPDGKWLLGSNGGAPTVWDVQIGEPVMTLDELTGEQEIAWMWIDGSYVSQVTPRGIMPSHENDYLLIMDPDGGYIVTEEGVFDTETEEMLLEWPPTRMRVTPGISPDGSLLVLPRAWSDTYVYDTQTWEIVASINAESVATAFSPDGTKLAVSSSWDIQIWDVAELLADGSE